MSDLPFDIILLILSRLPVKSLLRFESVSKPWLSLICDPHFVRLHLRHMSQTYCTELIWHEYYGFKLYAVQLFQTAAVFDFPREYLGVECDLVYGSCNGLLCFEYDEYISIWNPSTDEYKKLPCAPTVFELPDADITFRYIFCGFSYDFRAEDYKVVKVVQDADHNAIYCTSTVMVYTLGTNSWARIDNFNIPIFFHTPTGVVVNGCLNWLGAMENTDHRNHEQFVSFDFATEKLSWIMYPEKLCFVESLGVLGGNICAVHQKIYEFDVWVMKDYGVKDSWTKLFTISETSNGIHIPRPSRVLCFNKNGRVVLFCGKPPCGQLLLYDLEHETVELFRGVTSTIGSAYGCYAFQASLVSL